MASRQATLRQPGRAELTRMVLLGCGHAHLSALRHWRGPPPLVVTRSSREAYSGLVPAMLRRERGDSALRLDRAVAAAGGELLVGTAAAIDPSARRLLLTSGQIVAFDLLSLDLGAASAAPPGAWPVRPATGLAERVRRIEAGPPGRIAVVGGGAAGTELALALAARWGGSRAVVLITPGPPLERAPGPIRRRARTALDAAGVEVLDGRAVRVGAEGVVMTDGTVAAVAVLWAAGLVASGLPRAAGLACDANGFVAVDRTLRSLSHANVFAAGDCAATLLPKSGAHAVAAGRTLAANLARAAAERPSRPWHPRARTLAAIGLGGGRGLAWRGPLWLAGRPAWWLKSALDQRWVALAGLADPEEATAF